MTGPAAAAPGTETGPDTGTVSGANTGRANPHRGEAFLRIAGQDYVLRPSFGALVAAEEELGPLFALVERAGGGQLALADLAGLFWHCLSDPGPLARADVEQAIVTLGLSGCAAPLRIILGQILRGAG
ncbi:gene transfer agent family protein [Pontixanthobacter sp.]|uniref:gene transfer agent family protein n=1 Tax=Pontixanthobacter sp. TaxID=2792078 RepID=UPI003C79C16A